MTHSFVFHVAFICVPWIIHVCAMSHSYQSHESFTCLLLTGKRTCALLCVPWLLHMCATSYHELPRVINESFRRGKFSTNLSPSERIRQVQNTTSYHNSGTMNLNSIVISTVRGHAPNKYPPRNFMSQSPGKNSNQLRISWSDTSFSPTAISVAWQINMSSHSQTLRHPHGHFCFSIFAMAHPYVCHELSMSPSYPSNDLFICLPTGNTSTATCALVCVPPWLIHMCAMSNLFLSNDLPVCLTGTGPFFFSMCSAMAHPYVCHESFISMCAMSHLFLCVSWPIHTYHMIPWLVYKSS